MLSSLPRIPGWATFWRFTLLLCGTLFLSAALIFFIAWNWSDMHRFARLALAQTAILLTALASVYRGTDSVSGRTALLACGICAGPMLAVFGQTYQSGAQLWELFRIWAAFLFILALAGRQAALWLVTMIVSSIFSLQYLGRNFNSPEEIFFLFVSLPEFLLAETLALAAWEGASWFTRSLPEHYWLRVRWLPRLLAFSLMGSLTSTLFIRIIDGYHSHFTLLLPIDALWPLYALCLGGGWLWFRYRAPDLFMLACGLASLAALSIALLLRAEIFIQLDFFSFIAWGLIVVGLTWGLGRILLALQRTLNEGVFPPLPAASLEHESVLTDKIVDATSFGLRRGGAEGRGAEPAQPWYVLVMLAFGGWMAALLFLAAIGFFLTMSLGLNLSDARGPLLIGSIPLLALGSFSLRRKSFLVHHFGFALALAGTGGASTALAMLGNSTVHWPLPAVLPLAVAAPFMPSSAYRFLAAAGIAVLPALWLSLMFVSPWPMLVWWGLIAFLMAWRGFSDSDTFGSLTLGAYAGIAFFVLFATAMSFAELRIFYGTMWPGTTGLAAGMAFTSMALITGRENPRGPLRFCLPALAVFSIPLGWFLPGAVVGLLGLGLGRRTGNRVLIGASGLIIFAYMIYFYYQLNISLAQKSIALAVSGLALLVAALVVKKLGIRSKNTLRIRKGRRGVAARTRAIFITATIGVLLAGFNFSVVQKEELRANGQEILLALAPVDPRTLLMGDYMTLDFAVNHDISAGLRKKYANEETPDAGMAIVRLAQQRSSGQARRDAPKTKTQPSPASEKPENAKTPGTLAEAVFVRLDDGSAPLADDERRLFFRMVRGSAVTATSAFYFEEGRGKAYEKARYGLLRLGKDGETLLMNLCDANGKPIIFEQ